MPSRNQIRQVKRNKIKKNRSKLCQLKSTDTMTADTRIINLDNSYINKNTTNNINLDISISESDKSLKQSLTPLINIKKLVLNKKGILMLSRLSKPFNLMPNSAIISFLTHNITSSYIMADEELDRVQWELESVMSSIFDLKNTIRDNFQSLASITLADYQQYGITKSSKLSDVESIATTEILLVNESNEMKYEIDSSSETTESSLESIESISVPDEPFWDFAKPYLAHVCEDDLSWLKSLVLSYDTNLSEITPLNEHYTKVWAREKLTAQSNQPSVHSWFNKSIQQMTNVMEPVNKVNHSTHDDSVLTVIFQRIVSALREYSHASQKDNTKENIEYECIEDKSQDISNFCKQLYKENNVKNQIFNLGLTGSYSKPVFLPSISESDTDVDEILEELIKCDLTLINLQEGNKHVLTKLFKKCSLDYREQKIRNKINKVNSKILKFKKQSIKNSKRKKNTQIANKNNVLCLLIGKRNKYLTELSEFIQNEVSGPSTSIE